MLSSSRYSSFQVRIFIAIPFIVLVALLVAAGSGKTQTLVEQPKQHRVAVQTIQIQNAYQVKRLAVGQLESPNRALLGFELSGTFVESLVDEGESVQQGQLIGRLDTKRLLAQQGELKATLARADADARLAQLSEKRIAQLVAKNLESNQVLDEAEDATISANARVAEVQAQLHSIDVQLEKSKLYAPFDGTILSRNLDPGSVVGQGQTVFVMQQETVLEARIALGEQDAAQLSTGQVVTLIHQDQPIQAQVKSIAQQRALQTRTVDVIFSLKGTHSQLLPGDLVSFEVSKQVSQAGAWVPLSALTSSIRGLWRLYVIESIDGLSTISTRSVNVLYTEQDRAYVSGAIEQNDQFVVNGSQRLVARQQVVVSLDAISN